MNASSIVRSLLQREKKSEAALLPELQSMLTQLLALLEYAVEHGPNLDSLRKSGASREKPLPPTTAEAPYYVDMPIGIEIVNVHLPTLLEDLKHCHPVSDGHGNTLLTIPGPLLK